MFLRFKTICLIISIPLCFLISCKVNNNKHVKVAEKEGSIEIAQSPEMTPKSDLPVVLGAAQLDLYLDKVQPALA